MTMVWQDIGGRPYMEDTVSCDLHMPYGFSYYAIFDGHGGSDVSAYLQQHMKDVVRKHIIEAILKSDKSNKTVDIPSVLYDSIKSVINDIPYQIALTTGSTAVVMLKHGNKVWIANVGDSRAIMNNGHDVIELTKDHKPYDEKEYQRIVSLGGNVSQAYPGDVYRVNGVLAVSRAIGDFSLTPHVTWKPDITAYTLNEKNHYVFLATDGVWDVLSSQEVINIINEQLMKEAWNSIGNAVISVARSKGSTDNIACVFIVV